MRRSYPHLRCDSAKACSVGVHVISKGEECTDVFRQAPGGSCQLGGSSLMGDRHPEVHVSWADRHLWARGYYVETVGNVNEETVRAYIRNQEENDKLEDSTKK